MTTPQSLQQEKRMYARIIDYDSSHITPSKSMCSHAKDTIIDYLSLRFCHYSELDANLCATHWLSMNSVQPGHSLTLSYGRSRTQLNIEIKEVCRSSPRWSGPACKMAVTGRPVPEQSCAMMWALLDLHSYERSLGFPLDVTGGQSLGQRREVREQHVKHANFTLGINWTWYMTMMSSTNACRQKFPCWARHKLSRVGFSLVRHDPALNACLS